MHYTVYNRTLPIRGKCPNLYKQIFEQLGKLTIAALYDSTFVR